MGELRGTRYFRDANAPVRDEIAKLPFLDFDETLSFYRWFEHDVVLALEADHDGRAADDARAIMNCNDRYYLLTITCHRQDAWHPWLFERCREVEANPDGFLDLWARYHYKSSIGTFAGILQEIILDPEIKVGILSCTGDIAKPFLVQLQQEMEGNEDLKRIHSDVFWQNPRREAPKWSQDEGLVVKRKSNPKEATVEAHGLIEAMPAGRHFDLLNYDDLVTEKLVTNPEMIKKVTERWELSDNLGSMHKTRKWHWGTRYSFADTYGVLLERRVLKERRFPATDNGELDGKPILMPQERWEEVKSAQRSTVAAQMLLNPLAGNEATFRTSTFKHYDVIPSILNVYIMVDPSKGRGPRSDRTAIAVIGIDVGGNKYLLDGYCHRMKFSERYEYVKQLRRKWTDHPGVQNVTVGYEQYGMQIDLEVIETIQQRDGDHFAIEEMNSSKDGSGKNAKNDRIGRLEPDLNRGRFYLPVAIYHPDFAGQYNNSAIWDVWTEANHKEMKDAGAKDNPAVGTIVYRPQMGPTREQRYCEATDQHYRIVSPIKRRDEDGKLYDLTRAFIEEARLHPFAVHDDLLDACSRVYDLTPIPPVPFEALRAEMPTHPDS